MDNAKSAAARAWAWYRALWAKGRWGIAAGIVIPLLILGTVQAALQSVGIVEPPPTATPRPTATDWPTRTPEPPMATDEPTTEATATAVPVLPMEAPPTAAPLGLAAIPQEPAAPVTDGCVNINAAGFDDLRRIIHVEVDRANEIIAHRARRPFRSVDDLRRVPGIGEKRLEDIKAQGLACVK